MAVVTDPQLIERLKRLKLVKKTPDTSSNVPAGLVTDEAIIKRLQALKVKQVEKKQGSTEESTVSAVPEGSAFGDFFRTVAAVGSSAVAEPLAGLAGLGALIGTAGDSERAAQTIESARESLTYSPETAGSQAVLQGIGETLAPIAEGFETVSSTAGDTVYEWTGSPALAAAAYSIPTAALELAGIKGFRGIQRLKDTDLRKAQKVALLDPELKYSGSVAEVKLNKKGQLVTDKAGVKLVENGIRSNDAAVITNSNPATKKQMSEMVKAFEEGKGNDILAMSNKTTKAIGNSVTNRLQVLQSNRKALGSRLDEIVKGEVGDTRVDITNSLTKINAMLKEEGIMPRVRRGELSLQKASGEEWYKGTSFDIQTMAPVRKTIEDAYKLFDMKTSLGKTNLRDAHKLKKNLDEFIDAAKLAEGGIAPTTMRAITEMRSEINNSLSQIDSYGSINKELGDIIEASKPFKKYLKQGQKWEDSKVSAVVGEAMKTISNDSVSAVELIADLSSLDKTLKARGIVFGDDPRALVQFRQTLLQNFNVDPSIPISGAARAAGGLAVSSIVGNTFGAAHDASRLISAGMKKKDAKRLAEQNKKAFNIIKMAVNQK